MTDAIPPASTSGEPWARNIWALTLIVFVAFVGFQFFSPFLPLYVHELGVPDARRVALWSGALAAVTPAISGLLGPLFGRLADRYGHKLMLMRSLAGFTVIIAAMGLVTSVEQLLVARVLQGLFAGFTPMAMAVASVSAPRDKVPTAIGMVQSAQLLSAAVGPAAGGYVASHFGIRYAFFVTAAMCALALFTLIFLFKEIDASAPGTPRRIPARLPLRDVFGYPNFPVVLLLLMAAQFVDRGLALLIPLQVAALPGMQAIAATSGLIISVAAVTATVSANAVARLSRDIPPARLLMLGLLVGSPLCAAMALVHGWPLLLVLRALVGLAIGGAITLAYTLGASIVPGEHRAAAFGWLALGVQVGTAASPLLTGAMAAVSLPGAFVVYAAVALAGAVVLAFGTRGLR
ncbi:MAG TPA: MFS transporter [Methylomirabilota bacterium]|nr:MFS transporter [Methylomirabilota bacterium]